MSKTDKMRGQLASIQRDREQFERQKKELENDMNVGRDNMNKIKKGLKNNSIASESIVVDEKLNNHHYGAHASPGASHMEMSPMTGMLLVDNVTSNKYCANHLFTCLTQNHYSNQAIGS